MVYVSSNKGKAEFWGILSAVVHPPMLKFCRVLILTQVFVTQGPP